MSNRGRPKKNNNKEVRVCIRLTRKELGRLKILADEREFSLSEMVRFLINSYYER